MKYPPVTILITIRNNADTVGMCIKSLLDLDYPKYKIMVVDAFSDDGTYEVLKSFGKKIELHQLKGWPATAYNWALKRIKTEYVALVDGDNKATKNWLKNLMSGFEEGVVEVAGFCKTPTKANKLQELIGRELENRYNKFGKHVPRVPTMNVSFKTELAKKLKFNEKLRIAYDTDFSYRISKYGKIRYVSNAILYHYHRASWKGFFKQQFINGKFVPLLFSKHRHGVKGDEISKPSMIVQPIFFIFGVLFALLSLLFNPLIYLTMILFSIIGMIIIYDSIRLTKSLIDFPYYILIFIIRLVGWLSGLPFGFLEILKK